MELSFEQMYKALLDKDLHYEGIFFTAVKTTGIFCRPSCTARKPKPENIEFFKSTKECILKGYRACKVCRPLEMLNETPEYIKQILNELSQDPTLKFKDFDLLQRGIEPHQIRRWFMKNHGITFHAYQRMFKINSAFKKIQNGASVTDVAFNSGFESLSGFGDSFKHIFGVSPKKSKEQGLIDLKRIETPLGTMYACATEQGICLLEFTDRKMLETEFKQLTKTLNATIVQGDNPHFDLLEEQLAEYFEGKRKDFSVPLFTPGSDFQNKVWKALVQIPYGETKSYKQQAINIGQQEAVRAVANANGMNKIAILIPCHRVIGTNGNLTGYGGGVWRKNWLLKLENQHR
ncbi:methylated-DNA--[protein]-cysteine S-methyltransferase [Sphingobacterium sp. SRCM116780]|uniref:bifunctional transcriptional activator/DNA repair enzyme AdaA n=1 Tax=Sphingobacterium sp. SRCM116780 TaxID=2907623 RepID=UPI001F317BB8|nr:methylated-DNA--[protein]-cysteine S-methyltransferase [Sphingobacterium sp. SRCM116780]UIR57296.1 methylated-DNA--[protein]-cysteine S-methyltransferase [Sphingobacterium sp. SRCM116780]